MIGQCTNCGDPSADLKLNKVTDQVVCSNEDCLKVMENATPFFRKALRDQRDYLASSDLVSGNTLHCASCEVSTQSLLVKRDLPEGLSFKDASNQERYMVRCSICQSEKEVTVFALNALIETSNAQQKQ